MMPTTWAAAFDGAVIFVSAALNTGAHELGICFRLPAFEFLTHCSLRSFVLILGSVKWVGTMIALFDPCFSFWLW